MIFPAPKKNAKVIKPNAIMSVILSDFFKLHLPTRVYLDVVSVIFKLFVTIYLLLNVTFIAA